MSGWERERKKALREGKNGGERRIICSLGVGRIQKKGGKR